MVVFEKCEWFWIIVLGLLLFFDPRASAQSQQPGTALALWSQAAAQVQLPDNWRMLAFAGSKNGADGYNYDQWNVATGPTVMQSS